MNKEDDNPKKKKEEEDPADKVEIKNKEKTYFEGVFSYLCSLEEEPSSDEGSAQKKYQRQIEENAQQKRMKIEKSNFKSKTLGQDIKKKKTYKEDKEKSPERKKKEPQEQRDPDPESEEKKLKKKKFGPKAIRKVMRKLTKTFNKEEIKLMIWEIDSNLDGFITYDEYERMYKRCVSDTKEKEPKKLYYLVQFLMFDKEKKDYITVEDTLEVLCVRNTNGIDAAIDDIFNIEEKDEKGNQKKPVKKNETLTYQQFSQRMHNLSLKKRTLIMNKKKLFCQKVQQEALKEQQLKNNH